MATIGKYQIVEQIGEGAMGVVYKALDPVLNRTVAIKVMSEGLAQDEVLRERFLREAQAAGSLQHPNLVTIYDFGETDGHLYIAMEFIEGADLESLMAKGTPLNLPTKLDLIIDVLNGLSFAHRRGIVHRDIKPANIRIDQEGRARIMDFGVAKMSQSNLTSTGVMMGTPNYMAPEQITGDKALGPTADLWGVGAVLYELLTNQRPFEADTLHRVLFKIVSDNPANVTRSDPGLPPALDDIVSKALAKEPENRYKSAAEMANAIAAVRANVGAPRLSRTVSQRSSIEAELRAAREKGQQDASGGGRTYVPADSPALPAHVAAAPAPIPTPVAVPAVAPSRPNWALIGGGALVLLIAVGGVSYLGSKAGRDAQTSEPAAVSPQAGETRPAVSTTPPAPVLASQPERNAPQAQAPPPSAPPPSAAAASRGNAVSPPRTTPRRTAAESTTAAGIAPPQTPVQSAPAPANADPPVTSQTQQSQAQQSPPPTPPASPPQQTVSVPTQAATAAPVVDNPRPAIEAVLEAYARAIGTRQLAEMKRVYAQMNPQQQAGWEGLFSSTRSITATLGISSLNVGTGTATARVTGNYEFVNRSGRTERQPASFEATFAKQGDAWVLQRIR